jgi:hypothetical protein
LKRSSPITIEKSGKDITRLCFVSFDQEAYYNTNASVFNVQPVAKSLPDIAVNLAETFNSCVRFTEQKESYLTGNRNNFIFQLACNLNRKGPGTVNGSTAISKNGWCVWSLAL